MSVNTAQTPQSAKSTTVLALSYSGLLASLAAGKISLDELSDSLFYFGCGRSHVFDRSSVDRYLQHHEKLNAKQRHELHDKLCELIIEAEANGKAIWRPESGESTWSELNELLMQNELPPIKPTSYHYSYPGVQEAIDAQRLPYTIAHHC